MKSLNKSTKITFWFALALSFGFPLGIIGVIFGAINKMWALLVIGIILVVVGFYVMPILWVKYGEKRHLKTILYMIERERLCSVKELSIHSGFSENAIRDNVRLLINKRYLTGYFFVDDVLQPNKKYVKEQEGGKCECCGAKLKFDGKKFFCEYCGND